MPKKTKQRKRPAPPRRPAGGPAPAPPDRAHAGGPPAPAARPEAGPAPAAPPRRGIQRIDPAGQRRAAPRPGRGDAGFAPLDSDDAAIPFDRVPYVPADLRRVAMMASAMIVLIIVANLVISRLTG